MTVFSTVPKYITTLLIMVVVCFGCMVVAQPQIAAAEEEVTSEEMTREALIEQIIALLLLLLAQDEAATETTGATDDTDTSDPVTTETVSVPGAPDIVVGNVVATTDILTVRALPAGDFIRLVPNGTTGGVIDGPEKVEAYWWYKIDYGSFGIGWSAADWLEVTDATTEVPTSGSDTDNSIFDFGTVSDGTKQYEITVNGVLFDGQADTLVEVSGLCRRYIEANPGAAVTCYWGDTLVQSVSATGENSGSTATTNTNTGSGSTGTTDTGATDSSTPVVNTETTDNVTVAEVLGTYEVSISLVDGGTRQVHFADPVTEAAAEAHCGANYDSWVAEFKDQYPGRILRCLWENDENADTYRRAANLPSEGVVINDTTWNSLDRPSYACSDCGQAFCTYSGHGSLISFTEADVAGQTIYGCWASDDPTACAACWESPWTEDGCNILTQVTCAP